MITQIRHRRIAVTVFVFSVAGLGALFCAAEDVPLDPASETFTAVREVILDSSDQQGYRVFDLDKARSIEVPEELQKFQYAAARRDQFEGWMRQQGGDVCYYQWDAADFAKEAPEEYAAARRTPDFFSGVVLRRLGEMNWSRIFRGSKEFVPWHSLHFSQLKLVPVAGQALDTMTVGEVAQVLDGQEAMNHEKSNRTDLPGTYAFRTADGASGILQITGPSDAGRKVALRYKLVQQ